MTPGPWIVETYNTKYPDLFEYNIVSRSPANGEQHTYGVVSGLDNEPDARLIAAAPDLLAAAKRAVKAIADLEGTPIHYTVAIALADAKHETEAAIAKAQGKP